MEFAEKILRHPNYRNYLEKNEKADQNRKLCLHDLQHAVDTARVAYIVSLEEGLNLNKDLIYSAALLHDIAKWMQIQDNRLDHASEGVILAEEILRDIGMDARNTALILDAIRTHRYKDSEVPDLNRVLYAGDKLSRFCMLCENIGHCNKFTDGQVPVLHY